MKIYRVLVDKLPTSCATCRFKVCPDMIEFCDIQIDDDISLEVSDRYVPPMCPLYEIGPQAAKKSKGNTCDTCRYMQIRQQRNSCAIGNMPEPGWGDYCSRWRAKNHVIEEGL